MTGTEPDAEGEIGAVLDQAYIALDFDPGAEPDWSAFDECFVENAVLALRVFPDDPSVSILGLEDYARSQMRHGLSDEGYSETPVDRTIQIVGAVAVAHQHFVMNFRSGPVPAIDIFSLASTEGGWRIVSVVSDLLRPQP